jgi:hypothetical protein
LQPVATTSLVRFGITASHNEFTDRVLFVAQVVIVGAAGASTVTVKSQIAPSLPVQVTTVVPTVNVDPDAGVHVTVPQVPLVVGAE